MSDRLSVLSNIQVLDKPNFVRGINKLVVIVRKDYEIINKLQNDKKMAKYLDTSQISSELMQLLKEAKEKIILVTFSLQVNSQIQERLKTKSKLGTLSEITVIYGNPTPKISELKWMEEIEDLKIWQKKNLHAKCYLNESKAIISSMNLYDYSQTTNIEMGFLITKEENPEAFEQLLADIADLKINGDRKKIAELLSEKDELKSQPEKSESKLQPLNEIKNIQPKNNKLSYKQQLNKFLLESLRKDMSTYLKQNANSILSDEIVHEIITQKNFSKNDLTQILKSDKKAKQIGNDILEQLARSEYYTIGKVIDTRYESNNLNYEKVKLERFDNKEINWYDTKEELPKKGQIVAVKLNDTWFNKYIVLEESNIEDEPIKSPKKDYSKSNYYSTKELSETTGISSQTINNIFVSEGLMQKKDNDWLSTEKGKQFGAIQKEGQYGKFVVWPDEIVHEVKFKK